MHWRPARKTSLTSRRRGAPWIVALLLFGVAPGARATAQWGTREPAWPGVPAEGTIGDLGALAMQTTLDVACEGPSNPARLAQAYRRTRRLPSVRRELPAKRVVGRFRDVLLPAVHRSESFLRRIDRRARRSLEQRCAGDWLLVFTARKEAFERLGTALDAARSAVWDAAWGADDPRRGGWIGEEVLRGEDSPPQPDVWRPAHRARAAAIALAAQDRRIGPEVERAVAPVFASGPTGAVNEVLPWVLRGLERMTFQEPERPACAELDTLHSPLLAAPGEALEPAGSAAVSADEMRRWNEETFQPFFRRWRTQEARLRSVTISAFVAGCPRRALDRLARLAAAIEHFVRQVRVSAPRPDEPPLRDGVCTVEPFTGHWTLMRALKRSASSWSFVTG